MSVDCRRSLCQARAGQDQREADGAMPCVHRTPRCLKKDQGETGACVAAAPRVACRSRHAGTRAARAQGPARQIRLDASRRHHLRPCRETAVHRAPPGAQDGESVTHPLSLRPATEWLLVFLHEAGHAEGPRDDAPLWRPVPLGLRTHANFFLWMILDRGPPPRSRGMTGLRVSGRSHVGSGQSIIRPQFHSGARIGSGVAHGGGLSNTTATHHSNGRPVAGLYFTGKAGRSTLSRETAGVDDARGRRR